MARRACGDEATCPRRPAAVAGTEAARGGRRDAVRAAARPTSHRRPPQAGPADRLPVVPRRKPARPCGDAQGHRAGRSGGDAAGLSDRGRGVRDRRLRAGGGVGGAGHDRHRRPVPDRGGHPGPEGGGGGPSGAAAQRLAADGPAVALPELCQPGLQRPGPPRLRPPSSTGPARHFTVLDLLDRLCGHCHALKTRQNWSLVEGRGKRALVPPEDRPASSERGTRPPRPPPDG